MKEEGGDAGLIKISQVMDFNERFGIAITYCPFSFFIQSIRDSGTTRIVHNAEIFSTYCAL